MALPFTEAFTGSIGVLANPPWTQAGFSATTLNLDGSGHGKASAFDSAKDVAAYDNSNSYSGDHYAQVVIAGGLLGDTLNYAEAWVRMSGSGGSLQGYQLITDGASGATHTELWKFTGGAGSLLTNFAATFATNDVIKLQVIGNVLTAFKNGVSIGTFTDSSSPLSGGAPGCGVYNNATNNVLLDNFQSDNAVGSSPSVTVPETWRPPGVRAAGPARDPLGFLIRTYNYVEGPSVVPPPAPPPRLTMVRAPKRHSKRSTTTVQVAKVAQTTTVKPRAPLAVVQPKKRRAGKRKTAIVTGARRAAATVTATPKQPVVVTQKRKRRRTGQTIQLASLLTGALASVKGTPAKTVKPAKRRSRTGKTTLVRAQVAVSTTRLPKVSPTLALVTKRPPKRGKTTLVKGAPRATVAPSVRPGKVITVVSRPRRKQRLGQVALLVSLLPGATPPANRPPKTITTKLVQKRRNKLGQAKVTRLKKPRTPYITGVTRNSAGTPIPGCNVFVFRTADEVLVARGTSNSTGVYLLPVPSYTDNLFVVAYRADSPDIFGTTVNWLTGA